MPDALRDAVLIFNPASGRGRSRRAAKLEEARRRLAAAGIAAELQATSGPGEATALARRAVAERRQLLIVCGGDGTVNEAVNGLAGSQVPLAVLPAGTANVLAKELGIPWDIPRAAALIPGAKFRRTALGLARSLGQPGAERYFLCVAGAGPDGMMMYSVKGAFKQRAGILAYWLEGFRQLARYKFPRFRVSCPQEQFLGTLVVVGRTKHYGGPFRITTRADLFEDQFEIALVTTRSAARYLAYLPKLWTHRFRSAPGVFFRKTDRLCCEPLSAEPVYAQLDGEPFGRLPLEFRVVRDALTLACPALSGAANARETLS
jgi:diacylglycerol kinase (ATP)